MPSSQKCRRVPTHCRKLSRGRKAKPGNACQTKSQSGTRVKSFYTPKRVCSPSAARIQAAYSAYRRRLASQPKKKYNLKKKKTPNKYLHSGDFQLY